MKKLLVATATVGIALGMSAPAFAKLAVITTQGASGKTTTATNSGVQTTTSPKGQVKNSKDANTTVTGPGNSMP